MSAEVHPANQTQGLTREMAASLSYVLFMVTGIVFFVIGNKDPFIKFHAAQSVLVFTILFALQWLMGSIAILSSVVPLLAMFSFILWLVLIYKSWMGDLWEVPLLGQIVKKFLKTA